MSIFKNKKVWKMIGYTALFLIIYRFGVYVNLPFIDRDFIATKELHFGFLEVFTGGALTSFSILALGISPYITASIVIQLLQMDIIPVLKEWSEQGEVGRQKINQLTRYVALALAFIQALTLTLGLNQSQALLIQPHPGFFTYVYLALVATAGTAFTLWLAEQITLKGIGNGTSMIIVAGILASFPAMFKDLIDRFFPSGGTDAGSIISFIVVILLFLLIIVGITFMEAATRKIPIQYANRPASASFSGRSDSNIPIKLNSASVIPVIFASTIMSLPLTILNFVNPTGKTNAVITMLFDYREPIGFVIYIFLIFVFSFFYSFLQMDPDKMAENLQNQNAYIPGIRPGAETASYISRILFKVTMVGATYLAVVASLPIVMAKVFKLPPSVQIGGTSLIIVVGVAIETTKQLQTESQEKVYRGFI